MNRRLPPQERRKQIVAAAREAIGRHGLARLSLRDIAAAAGVSMGTVTYHFASIDEILSGVVIAESELFYGTVIAQAENEPDPRRALDLLLEPMFRDDPDVAVHWRIWADYWATVARRPEVAEVYAGRIRRWEDCCRETIRRGVDSGIFAAVDPEETALKLAAYSDGLGTQLAQAVPGFTAGVAHTWMKEFADLLLRPNRQP